MPDEITVKLWQVRIDSCVKAHTFRPDIDFLVLDGIPRNVSQATLMKDTIDVRKVFHLSCPERSKLVERLKRRALKENRLDDANEEVIRRRLQTYEDESKPLLSHYGPALTHDIDATQAPIKVLSEILSVIVSTGAGFDVDS